MYFRQEIKDRSYKMDLDFWDCFRREKPSSNKPFRIWKKASSNKPRNTELIKLPHMAYPIHFFSNLSYLMLSIPHCLKMLITS